MKIRWVFLTLLLTSCTYFDYSSTSSSVSTSSNIISSISQSITNTSNESSTTVTNTSSSNESSIVTSSTSSSSKPSSSSSSTSTSKPSSSSSTSIKDTEFITIKDIKERAKKYIGLENNVGVYESNEYVEIELRLIACLDAITTKTGYGDRYKILMSDGIDYIYIKTKDTNYSYLEKYVENGGVYHVKGNISLYNNEVELTVTEKPTYLENKSIEIDYDNFEKYSSLDKVYQDLYNLKLNCKGIAFSKIIGIEVVCLVDDINNTNLYFGVGDKIINVHGSDKVTNKFVVGSSYLLYGALNMYNFRPSLEYVYAAKIDENIIRHLILKIEA